MGGFDRSNRHVKILCERCSAVRPVDGLDDFNAKAFYDKHAKCPKPRSIMRPFEPGFIRKIVNGVLRGYNHDHPHTQVPGNAFQSIAKRVARQVYKAARVRGLPHPIRQENTKYIPRRYRHDETTDQP